MKKLLIIVVVAIVVVTGLAVAEDHYKNYQNKQEAQAPQLITVKQADQKVKDAVTAAGGEYQSLVVSYNQAVAECQKGVAAYAKLTSAQRVQTASPVCPTAKV